MKQMIMRKKKSDFSIICPICRENDKHYELKKKCLKVSDNFGEDYMADSCDETIYEFKCTGCKKVFFVREFYWGESILQNESTLIKDCGRKVISPKDKDVQEYFNQCNEEYSTYYKDKFDRQFYRVVGLIEVLFEKCLSPIFRIVQAISEICKGNK